MDVFKRFPVLLRAIKELQDVSKGFEEISGVL